VPVSTSIPGGDGFEITGLVPGIYALEITSTVNGCTESLADLDVDVEADNIDLNVQDFVDGCGNVATIFYATSGQLKEVLGPGNVTPGATSVTVDQPGVYTITVEDPNNVLCDSTRTVEVNLAEIILVEIDTAPQDCSGSRILSANVTNPDPTLTYTYQWYEGSPVNGTRIDGAVARQHSITQAGTYSVRVGTNENVCESEATISDVEIRPALLVELEAFSDCENQSATIIQANVNQPNVELIWFDPGGIEIPGTRDLPAINVNQRGNYSVLVSNDAFGVTCSALESISLFDICPPQIFAHNAIRPESSIPENRTFYIHNPNDIADDFQVFIFNRWGEMIFESSDKFFNWNGTYRGKDVPVGTYPYLMRFKFPDDPEVFEKRGGVAVVR
jgi:gliding motility-associated-like protein